MPIINEINSLPPLREIVREYALNADKSLGQHFLLDLNITNRIVRNIEDIEGSTVIEIGPGPGGLTRSLLMTGAAKVIALEKDERCIEALSSLKDCVGERLEIVPADALEIDETEIYKKYGLAGSKLKIVSNLPYNISTVLLIKWLDNAADFSSLTLMFQREVADRIIARPGVKLYGRLSVLSQWLCSIKRDYDLPASAFVPPPKIDSTVLSFTPYSKPIFPANKDSLQKLCKAVFGQRRKMLRSSLKQVCDSPEMILAKCGINPESRPETLELSKFCLLSSALDEQEWQ